MYMEISDEELSNEPINELESSYDEPTCSELPKLQNLDTPNDTHEDDGDLKDSNAVNETSEDDEDNLASQCQHMINDTGLNTVDNLLKNKFCNHTYEEQLEIRKLGPHKPRDVKITQTLKNQVRHLSTNWFDKIEWLTVSVSNQRLYCFYCLLFEGDTVWSSEGTVNIKNITEKAKMHNNSKTHIACCVKYKCFSQLKVPTKKNKNAINAHNELVDKHRNNLGRIFDCLLFCAKNNVEVSSPEGNKIFLNLVNEIATFDKVLLEHIQINTPYTSKSVQDELLDYINVVYQEEILKDLENANYVSIHVDKIGESKFAIFLRYIKNEEPTVRLYSFVTLEANTTVCLAETIKKELNKFKLDRKVIAQSYDGSVTASGPYGGIQNIIKEYFAHALYVHNHIYSFVTIIKQSCSSIPYIKSFFLNADRFAQFFIKRTKQSNLLEAEYLKNTKTVRPNIHWKSDVNIITSLYHNQGELDTTFAKIKSEFGWNSKTILEATILHNIIVDEQFIFLVRFFYTIYNYIEVLLIKYEQRKYCGEVMIGLRDFESAIVNLMEVVTQASDSEHRTACIDSCGIVITEIRERIQANDHLITYVIVDPQLYKSMRKFPNDHLSVVECRYPMLNLKKLVNELKVLYSINTSFFQMSNEGALLKLLKNTELKETFSELCKFIEITLTTPKKPIEEKSCSEKLIEFLKTNVCQDKQFILAVLAIHNDVIDNILDLKQRVIEYFASDAQRKQFLYLK